LLQSIREVRSVLVGYTQLVL